MWLGEQQVFYKEGGQVVYLKSISLHDAMCKKED